MNSDHRVLSSFTLPNGTELKNRLFMAPMTTCSGYFDGSVSSELVEYYRVRAGRIGTIIVECCFVDDLGLAFPGRWVSTATIKLPGWRKLLKPSNPRVPKRCCKFITVAVWLIRS